MKQQIRQGVFETNSSSTHTISISKSDAYQDTIEKMNGGTIGFRSGEFGWEHELYDDIDSKTSYLWTGIIKSYFYTPEQIEKIKENITSVLQGHGLHAWFEGYEVKEYSDGKKYTSFKNYGYVDHAEWLGEWLNELFPNKGEDIYGDMLIWYLFNPNSCIETSNDNDCYESLMERNHKVDNEDVIEFYKGN